MKHLRPGLWKVFIISILLMLLVSMTSMAAPQSVATTKNLSTNYTLVNMSTVDDATVAVQYLKEDGSVWDADNANESFVIPKNFGQKVVAQYFDTTMSAGKGSAVVSSSAPLGAVVQILARNQTPTSGAYSGIITPSEKYYAPLVQKKKITASGLSSAQIMIQNTETTAQSAIKVDFIAAPGTGLPNFQKTNIAVQPGATYYYDVSDEAGLPDNWTGSAVITADPGKKVGVVVNLFAGPNTLTTYNAFSAESVGTGWAIPMFTSRLSNGLSTVVSVQNVSGAQMAVGSITMDCSSSISTPETFSLSNTLAIADNGAYSFNPVTDMTIPARWSGACLLSAPGSVVVFVTLRAPSVNEAAGSYEAFNTNSTNTKVVIPLMSKRQGNGFATVAVIQNLDRVNNAEVQLTYTPSAQYSGSQTPITFPMTIKAGGSIQQNLRFNEVPQLPDGWYGTLLVEAAPGKTARPLVGFVQLTNYLSSAGDLLMCHNAFTLP